MIFETERLILRPWLESDAPDLYEYAKDPAVGPSAGWPVHQSVGDSLEIIRTVLSEPETYAVVLKETGRVVGSIGLFLPSLGDVKPGPNELEIGYWIGVPYWGRGLIPEAVRRLTRYAFESLGCSALWCSHFAENDKSRRVQEKCGFVYHHTAKVCWPLIQAEKTEHFNLLTREMWEQNHG